MGPQDFDTFDPFGFVERVVVAQVTAHVHGIRFQVPDDILALNQVLGGIGNFDVGVMCGRNANLFKSDEPLLLESPFSVHTFLIAGIS